MTSYRLVVSVMPKEGILDPQGRAVEQSLPHLGVTNARGVRVGRRIEITLDAGSESEARETVERLAHDLFGNPLIETTAVDLVEAMSSIATDGVR